MAGIVDALTHASAHGGGTATFAVGSNKAAALKVSELSWKPHMGGQGLPRLNAPSSWPGHVDPRELVVDLQGRIVSATPSAYWDARKALLASLIPPPTYNRSIFHHGTLTATFPGESAAYLLVNLLDYDIPLTSQIGRSTEYRISWVAYFGYWKAVSGDTVVYY
jgi:hypothetical protein